jgi:hypothetical protein
VSNERAIEAISPGDPFGGSGKPALDPLEPPPAITA